MDFSEFESVRRRRRVTNSAHDVAGDVAGDTVQIGSSTASHGQPRPSERTRVADIRERAAGAVPGLEILALEQDSM